MVDGGGIECVGGCVDGGGFQKELSLTTRQVDLKRAFVDDTYIDFSMS